MMVKIIDTGPLPGVCYYAVADRQEAEDFIAQERKMIAAVMTDGGASISFEIIPADLDFFDVREAILSLKDATP